MAARLRARLLGRFELSVDGRSIDRSDFERPSGARLLKLVLATPGHRVRREAAADLLWPEMDPDRSSATLRKAIHFARRALEGGAAEGSTDAALAGDAEWLRLADTVTLDVGLDRLRDALDVARGGSGGRPGSAGRESGAPPTDWAALETVAELGGAELLPEDPYEEWLVPLRERLRQQTIEALLRGAALARDADRRDL